MRYLEAEWIRVRGSTLWWLALAGLLLGVVFTAFGFSGQVQSGTDLMNWHGLMVTGIAAPIAALFAGSSETRESRAREGGTAWRPASKTSTRAARLFMVWIALGVFCLLAFGSTALIATLVGLSGGGRVLLTGFYFWVGLLGVAGLAAALSRRIGWIPTIAVALVWQILLGFFSEQSWWFLNPAAWPLRLVLPEMGMQFNLEPLEPTSPMHGQTPLVPFVLCVALAVVGAAAAVMVEPRRVRVRKRKETNAISAPAVAGAATPRPHTAGFGNALRGVHRAALTPSVVACLALSLIVLLMAMRYSPEVRHAIFTYALLPIGAGVLPVLVWPRVQPAWALMRTEHPGVITALCGWLLLVVIVVTLAGTLTGGAAVGTELRRGALAILVGGALALLSLLVTVRFGIAWALALTLVVSVFSLTIGGDVLASGPLWIVAPTAWPEIAIEGPRMIIAVVLGAGLLALAWWAASRQLRSARLLRG